MAAGWGRNSSSLGEGLIDPFSDDQVMTKETLAKVVGVEHTMMPPGGLKSTDGIAVSSDWTAWAQVLNVFTASLAIYRMAALRARSW